MLPSSRTYWTSILIFQYRVGLSKVLDKADYKVPWTNSEAIGYEDRFYCTLISVWKTWNKALKCTQFSNYKVLPNIPSGTNVLLLRALDPRVSNTVMNSVEMKMFMITFGAKNSKAISASFMNGCQYGRCNSM